jgi:hypothetical protein
LHAKEKKQTESAAVDHVVDTAGRADDHLHTCTQFVHVFANIRAADERVTRHFQVLAQRLHNAANL